MKNIVVITITKRLTASEVKATKELKKSPELYKRTKEQITELYRETLLNDKTEEIEVNLHLLQEESE